MTSSTRIRALMVSATLVVLASLTVSCGGKPDPGGTLHAVLSAQSADLNAGSATFDATREVIGDIVIGRRGLFEFSGDDENGAGIGRSVGLAMADAADASPSSGKSYPVSGPGTLLDGTGQIGFTDTDASGLHQWTASAGEIVITGVSGTRVSLTFTGVTMGPADSATKGTFTLDGTCTVNQMESSP